MHGVRQQLASSVLDFGSLPEDCPAAQEVAIVLHPYGTGPFAAPGASG